jgi:hypothetical protein
MVQGAQQDKRPGASDHEPGGDQPQQSLQPFRHKEPRFEKSGLGDPRDRCIPARIALTF